MKLLLFFSTSSQTKQVCRCSLLSFTISNEASLLVFSSFFYDVGLFLLLFFLFLSIKLLAASLHRQTGREREKARCDQLPLYTTTQTQKLQKARRYGDDRKTTLPKTLPSERPKKIAKTHPPTTPRPASSPQRPQTKINLNQLWNKTKDMSKRPL
jgi:hypothetical protein